MQAIQIRLREGDRYISLLVATIIYYTLASILFDRTVVFSRNVVP